MKAKINKYNINTSPKRGFDYVVRHMWRDNGEDFLYVDHRQKAMAYNDKKAC